MASLEMYPTVYYNMCKPLYIQDHSLVYNNETGNNRRKNKQIVVHPTIKYYSAVSKREADLLLLIWKHLRVKNCVQAAPVCVTYVYIYLLVCS